MTDCPPEAGAEYAALVSNADLMRGRWEAVCGALGLDPDLATGEDAAARVEALRDEVDASLYPSRWHRG